ncbi:acyl-CoA N-acyltransferase [Phaeosphaeriaceae sp. SRC1lsM3a]|nr:acyl-CoA N-acyltransferase [Stagonospora sp. SRC1lsM3a]
MSQPATTETHAQKLDAFRETPIPRPILTTARLIIREYHPRDAPSMSLHGNSAAVAKYMYLTFPHPYTLEAGETWIAMNIGLPHPCHFAICEASSPDTAIGSIGLKLGSDTSSHTAELGFWIGEKFWGKGYVTEATAAFTEWAFETFEGKDGQRLRRVFSTVWSGNKGSIRCFEKCGYAPEGIMKDHVEKNGEVMDLHLYGLTKADWETRK